MKKMFILFAVIFVCLSAEASAQTWREVSSVSDLIGKWEGSFVMSIPENPEEMIPKTSIDIKMELDCTASLYELKIILNLETFLNDFMSVPEIKQSGFTKDLLWMFLIMGMESQDNFEFIVLQDEFAISANMKGEVSEMLEPDNGEVYISSNKRTLKMVFYEKLDLGFGDEGLSEIVLNKK